jgi:hypothetical protein
MRPILLPVLCLAACSPAVDPATGPQADAAKPQPHAFEVQLTLSPRAIEKLGPMKEMVTIAGMYWGEPKADAKPRADEMGQINLGADEIVVQPASRMVIVPGAAIDPKVLESDVEGAPQVLVNVYTSRRAHEDNLINCGIYEGPIPMAQQKPVEIECDLLEPPAPEALAAPPNPG